jgi:competence protein ComEA
MTKLNKYWVLIIILLAAIIAIGGIVTWSKYSPSQPIEIAISPGQELQGEIYIGGAITNPGFYPLKGGDSIEALIQAAGGTTGSADLSRLKLHIPGVEEEFQSQKINLNRAEVWLLKALPGIGETRAQAIIDYRHRNGLFHNIKELTKVEGIGTTTFEQIKHLITVAD